ncbi:MAG: hypothetical protein ACRC5C_07350, partial [Bacilli bacterium]
MKWISMYYLLPVSYFAILSEHYLGTWVGYVLVVGYFGVVGYKIMEQDRVLFIGLGPIIALLSTQLLTRLFGPDAMNNVYFGHTSAAEVIPLLFFAIFVPHLVGVRVAMMKRKR